MHIQAGIFKGRKLLAPPGKAITRPITASVKKSLFGMLGPYLPDAQVLDLYCGTGTMGLEALSRGAQGCRFAERDRAVVSRLKRNIETVGASDSSTIWCGDVTVRLSGWLAGLSESVDIAFLDPPYVDARKWDWQVVEDKLFVPLAQRLSPDGLVVLRVPSEVSVPDSLGGLVATRNRKYGGMAITFYALPEAPTGETIV